jgi:hypothetical protein
MRAVISRDSVRIEFSGRGQMWNELLRPYVGGPEAPAEAEPAAAAPARAPAPAPAPVTPLAAAPMRPAPAQFTPHRADVTVSRAPVPSPVHAAVAAAPAPALAARPAAQPAVRTWYPPRPAQTPRPAAAPQPPQHFSSDDDDTAAAQVEPSADPATLYSRLSEIPGRRSERDGVLAAVWFLTRGERETSANEVEEHFASLQAFPDVKVVPLLLKHVHRTKTLEQGSSPKSVRLTAKGITAVRGRLVPV